ncbi:amino acid adenylation domain-containing protein [Kitasatospora sp. NPDC048239]|uniref:non-ribosomal peptide synthetase n=1 Tax=Kitasatospora sp. NPDC048239 TaxID=3364046 RepID=UPI003715AA72
MATRSDSKRAAATLVQLFEHSAEQFADRPAVSDDTASLSYAGLAGRSDAIAAVLRERGVGTDDRVGLYLARGVDVVAAILGILKAGAAYVAVDTRYPDARRDLMLTASGAKVVLSHGALAQRLAHLGVDVLDVDALGADVPGVDVPGPDGAEGAVRPATVGASDAASVLFTSGSSGTPKAIVLEHRNIVSFACNPSLPALVPEDRVGQISSLSFDAFHFEMWSTLASGAEIVVLPPVPDLLAADFQREMKRRRISAMLVPTMVVNHVVREDRDAFASLRILQAGGDVLLPSACRDLLAGRFRGELHNLYGPAEITTACTAHRVTAADAEADSVPIGRPLSGVTVLVLGADGTPVAPGETGEMYVGGPGLARGYLERPDLTAERFVANPTPEGPERLYRTGDLARPRADGVLEFVGRADNQVKIRGYRVEPGEVERGLRRHEGVHEVVVLPAGQGDDRRLVAFVVLDDPRALRSLRAYAEAELPDFMVPSGFVALAEIPANEHGKRDLEALHELLDQHHRRQESYLAPDSETERYLAELWGGLLAVEDIGRDDDFFALGGHSILAFRMQTRIRRDRGVRLDFFTIMRSPVLRDLAAAIDSATDSTTDPATDSATQDGDQ